MLDQRLMKKVSPALNLPGAVRTLSAMRPVWCASFAAQQYYKNKTVPKGHDFRIRLTRMVLD
jgi:hypothetical protein